ncbi:MAG: RrF2 family transcriptional regulator [Candidatus Sulfotelmatobacter sp.]
MQITRASDYAVRVMIHLAGLPPDSTVRQSELSQATEVSGHFLSKVLQQLVRSRLIRSQRGSGGGFALAVPATRISLLDVVEAIEGPLRLNQCLTENPSCDRKLRCPAHKVWVKAQEAIVTVLGSASMAHLASQARTDSAALYQLHDRPIKNVGAREERW